MSSALFASSVIVQSQTAQFVQTRSNEDYTALAAYRGGQWGMNYAEAFEVVVREY